MIRSIELKKYLPLLFALLIGAAIKTWLTVNEAVPFNGDEAIVALMADHILQGEIPVFFYGQAYMGSLDALLIAAAFSVFGKQVYVIRIVQSLLFLGYLITLWFLVRRIFKNEMAANISVILAAIPPVLVTLYTSATLGGYGESLILGNLVLLLGYDVTYGAKQENGLTWLLLGLASGLGFWVLGIIGIYLLPIGLIGIYKFRKKLIPFYGLAAIGFLLGSAPWWVYNFNNSWGAFYALAGPDLVPSTFTNRILSQILFGFPSLLGIRLPWRPEYFPWYISIFLFAFYASAIVFGIREIRTKAIVLARGAGSLIRIFILVFLGVLIISRFGIDPSGRYWLPMHWMLVTISAIFIGSIWRRNRILGIMFVASVVVVNLTATWIASRPPDRITTQFDPISSFDNEYDEQLISFLKQNGEVVGYTNNWVNYRLAFYTDEEIIYSAELPYKDNLSYTPVDNRISRYPEIVDASDQVAYITTKHPKLDVIIGDSFSQLRVTFQEKQIGPFHIFYGLSRAVRPEEIGYGDAAQ